MYHYNNFRINFPIKRLVVQLIVKVSLPFAENLQFTLTLPSTLVSLDTELCLASSSCASLFSFSSSSLPRLLPLPLQQLRSNNNNNINKFLFIDEQTYTCAQSPLKAVYTMYMYLPLIVQLN